MGPVPVDSAFAELPGAPGLPALPGPIRAGIPPRSHRDQAVTGAPPAPPFPPVPPAPPVLPPLPMKNDALPPLPPLVASTLVPAGPAVLSAWVYPPLTPAPLFPPLPKKMRHCRRFHHWCWCRCLGCSCRSGHCHRYRRRCPRPTRSGAARFRRPVPNKDVERSGWHPRCRGTRSRSG